MNFLFSDTFCTKDFQSIFQSFDGIKNKIIEKGGKKQNIARRVQHKKISLHLIFININLRTNINKNMTGRIISQNFP